MIKMLILALTVPVSGLPIQGIVLDGEKCHPIPGAQVMVENTGIGDITDSNGHFILETEVTGETTLKIQHIGYAAKTVAVDMKHSKELELYLKPVVLKGVEISVIGTRSSQNVLQVPGRVAILDMAELGLSQHDYIDFALNEVPGINIHRTSGNYEIRPVISIRGVGGDDPGRTLIMKDGIPINKSDTGVANLKRIRLAEVSRIEVLKGAASSLYGASAMGGVLNIITREETPGFSGYTSIRRGTHNSWNGDLGFDQYFRNGVHFGCSGYSGQSDGYFDLVDSLRDDYTVPLFLEEKGGNVRIGWVNSPTLSLQLEYDYDHDRRGEGYRIEHDLGNHRAFTNNSLQFSAQGTSRNWFYHITAYRQHEDYLRISEGFKRGSYNRYDVKSDRYDNGINGIVRHVFNNNNQFALGLDLHHGEVKGGDYYTTSTDTIINQGAIDLRAFYLQDELQWLNGRFRMLVNLRYDQACFNDGLFEANNPANALYDFNDELSDNKWTAWSPRLGLRYFLTNKTSFYASLSEGFRAAPLDDLTRTGFMRLGFKLANPEIGPERISSYEFGCDFSPNSNISISPSIYYSQGTDFLYFVATEDSLWGRKPIFKRENITEVEIMGAEMEVACRLHSTLRLLWHMTLNSSRIVKFSEQPDLEGNYLTLSPKGQSGLKVQWQLGALSLNLNLQYKGSQFTDDNNNIELAAYQLVHLRGNYSFNQNLHLGISMENLTNVRYLENVERLSPGRIIQIQAGYQW